MKYIIIFFLYGLVFTKSEAQSLLMNLCDSSVLGKEDFTKCIEDSVWIRDIQVKMNYIFSFKTQLLPKYRIQREKIQIPESTKILLKHLKHCYDSSLNYKLNVWETEMDQNQHYVQPKAYLSSLLSFQLFRFYPDIYAILINEIHLDLNPKTTREDIESTKILSENIMKQISPTLVAQLKQITTSFQLDKAKLSAGHPIEVFQGNKNDSYNIINFLLWTQ